MLFLTGHTLKDPDYTIHYHRGDLLTEAESEGLADAIGASRRGTVDIEASADAVLRELERAAG